MWHRGGYLTVADGPNRNRPRLTGPFLFLCFGPVLVSIGCEPRDPELIPDTYLQSELGLTDRDRVHTISISGGTMERADPGLVSVRVGDFVQVVSADWRVHEFMFEIDSLSAPARGFLERTDQVASPPLLQQGSRFVLAFSEAPPGRYPYALLGNTEAGRGVIVVEPTLAGR